MREKWESDADSDAMAAAT
ncbi:hypothetical protein L195_g051203, partial [Trifolium pratense]